MIRMVVMLVFLSVSSIFDIKTRKLSVWIIAVTGIVGIVLHILQPEGSIYDLAAGIGVGMIIMMISLVTKGQIGMGDGMLFASIGAVIGGSECVSLFIGAMLLCFIVSGVLLVTRQAKRCDRLPFVPFVLCAYIGQLLMA